MPIRSTLRAPGLAVTALAGLLTLAGCGDVSDPATGTDPAPTSSTSDALDPTTTTTPRAFAHPTGADDVVLRIKRGGGFVPVEYSFTDVPLLLATGDGRIFLPSDDDGATRLRGLRVVQTGETGLQQLLALAEQHRLLRSPPPYDREEPYVTDASTTVVLLSADGETYEHSAYALGLGGPPEPGPGAGSTEPGARGELAAFIAEAIALFDDAPGTAYEPAEVSLLVEAFGGEPGERSTVRDWTAPIDLADVPGCATVPAGEIPALLDGADYSTYVRQDTIVYTVSAVAVLPGEEPCGPPS